MLQFLALCNSRKLISCKQILKTLMHFFMHNIIYGMMEIHDKLITD